MYSVRFERRRRHLRSHGGVVEEALLRPGYIARKASLLRQRLDIRWSKGSSGWSNNFLKIRVGDGPQVRKISIFTLRPVINPETDMTAVSEVDGGALLKGREVHLSLKQVRNSSKLNKPRTAKQSWSLMFHFGYVQKDDVSGYACWVIDGL